MNLAAGTRLGAYEVVSALGAGGMGEVYRARDTRLNRDVALKILPEAFAADPDRVARFAREAQVLASLNHPHIAAIYGLEESAGRRALVLELVEGPTLADLIARGPIPVADVLPIARQIAEALAAAHDQGIVHRDLKPANVKVAAGGLVKVLDFGLAKAAERVAVDEAALTSTSPAMTELGVVLGTTVYMSPEQTRGRPVDRRTDVWAFGCVLVEMLSGTPAFGRDTTSDTIAAVLEREPPWDRLPADTPAAVRQLLDWCLVKDEAARLADLREVRVALEPSARTIGRARQTGRRWWAAAALAAVALAGLAYGTGALDFARRPASLAAISSVAVLPLAETSAAPSDEYFSSGLTNELIATLQKIRTWRVTSRTSVMQYRGTSKPLPVIARELGVDALVEGTVQRSQDVVRITIRLVRARPAEELLWTDTYDRNVRDVLDVQADVARDIASKIQLTLTPTERERLAVRRPVDPEVLDLYFKGRAAAELGTEPEIDKGIGYFNRALERDPTFAPAYAAMAIAYSNLTPSYRAPKAVMPKAREYAARAIALDGTLSEAHTALANVLFRYDWDWAGTEKEAKLAIELNPSSADARELYGNYLCAIGQQSRAVAELMAARDLNPSALTIEASLLGVYVTGRQYDETIREARRLLEKDPNLVFAHAWLGMAYAMQRKFDEALPELRRARELDDNVTTTHFLAIAEAAAGNRAEAEKLLKAIELAAGARYACAYEVASVHLQLGQTDKAMEWLRRGEDEQCDCMVWLTTEPWMDPLRVDARYAALVKRVGPAARK